ncbi:hypothetical protein X772_36265 [Mesorhizobium sp. LSJC280B00]|nr:hypothetical protein X772_36265 [Mesorhizobium sp. LSJC280B00]
MVGIDDWSWRRATSYGTIVVDLERRSVVDILDDRSVDSAAKWLRSHPSVEVVSRDRCGLYAQAIREGAPQARQVADRFHLVQNLRSAIEEQMSLSGRATGRAILSEDAIVDAATHRRRARLAHRQFRQEIFETLHALRDEGLSYSEIARRTGYERRSIANWLKFKAPPDRRRAALNPTSPWYFEAFLAQCRMGIAADGICFMTSNSGATLAVSPIWSGFSEPGGGPKESRPVTFSLPR